MPEQGGTPSIVYNPPPQPQLSPIPSTDGWYFVPNLSNKLAKNPALVASQGVTHTIATHDVSAAVYNSSFDSRLNVFKQDLNIQVPILCKYGLHASTNILDALLYAPGPVVWQVTLSEYGIIGVNIDKMCASHRTYNYGGMDITPLLRSFVCSVADTVASNWYMPTSTSDYFKSYAKGQGNDTLLSTAYTDAAKVKSTTQTSAVAKTCTLMALNPFITGAMVRAVVDYAIYATLRKKNDDALPGKLSNTAWNSDALSGAVGDTSAYQAHITADTQLINDDGSWGVNPATALALQKANTTTTTVSSSGGGGGRGGGGGLDLFMINIPPLFDTTPSTTLNATGDSAWDKMWMNFNDQLDLMVRTSIGAPVPPIPEDTSSPTTFIPPSTPLSIFG